MTKLGMIATILSLFISTSTSGQSARDDSTWEVQGTGSLSCGKWLSAREAKNEAQVNLFVQWVSGWIVSYNYYLTPGTTKARARTPDLETITAFVDKFCRENPLKVVAFAAAELVEQLGGKKAWHNTVQRAPAK